MNIDSIGLLEKGVVTIASAALYNMSQHGASFGAGARIGAYAAGTVLAASVAADIIAPRVGISKQIIQTVGSAGGWAFFGAAQAGVTDSSMKLAIEGASYSIVAEIGYAWMNKRSMISSLPKSMGNRSLKFLHFFKKTFALKKFPASGMVPAQGTGIMQVTPSSKGNAVPARNVTAVTSQVSRLY
jgi:hypothetical protein